MNDEPRAPNDYRWARQVAALLLIAVVVLIVVLALTSVAASALLMTETISLATISPPNSGDSFTLARIDKDREAATRGYLRDRDLERLQAAMSRLDAEERTTREHKNEAVTPAQARHYLENLSQLWEDTEPEGRKAIAEAAFDRVDAVGIDVTVTPTAEAEHYGWAEAFGPDPLVCTIGRYGRGERGSASLAHLRFRPRFVLENVTPAARPWSAAHRMAG